MKLLPLTVFVLMCSLLPVTGQSLLAVEELHGKLLMVCAEKKVSVSYLGGLSRRSAQRGLFSEQIGRWRLRRSQNQVIELALVKDKDAVKIRIGKEVLRIRFFFMDRVGAKVNEKDVEKVIGMKISEFVRAVESEDSPWEKPIEK